MPIALVTGAGRGLGLEFTRQYAADGWQVLACARHAPTADLLAIVRDAGGRVTTHALDVADHASVDRTAGELAATPVDVLINNAGVSGGRSVFGQTDYAAWLDAFRVNTLGPMKMAEAFAAHVAAGGQKKIVTLTSVLASIARNGQGGMYAYRSTKTAANAIVKSLAADLAPRGIIAVSIHPGWVKTDMGGPQAELAPAVSVGGMRKVIAGLTRGDSGRFLNYDGSELPW